MQTKHSISKLRRFAYFFIGFLMLSPTATFAQSVILEAGGVGETIQETTGLGNEGLDDIAEYLIAAILTLLGLVAVVLVIYAGFLWMTAQGQTDKIDKAKKLMGNSAIGLVIVMASYSISNFIGTTASTATGRSGSGTFAFINAGDAGLGSRDPEMIVVSIASGLLGILSLVAIVLVIAGGVMWMTSAGDETKVEKAQKLIKSSFIGLAIILTAFSITNYIGQLLVTSTGA